MPDTKKISESGRCSCRRSMCFSWAASAEMFRIIISHLENTCNYFLFLKKALPGYIPRLSEVLSNKHPG